MAKQLMRMMVLIVVAAFAFTLESCGSTNTSKQSSAKQKITYKCLSSSCDASVTCYEGDPVPEHCGKPMIR